MAESKLSERLPRRIGGSHEKLVSCQPWSGIPVRGFGPGRASLCQVGSAARALQLDQLLRRHAYVGLAHLKSLNPSNHSLRLIW
jgi:hypothetical protein